MICVPNPRAFRAYIPLPPLPVHPDDGDDDDGEISESDFNSLDDKDLYKYIRQILRRIIKAQKIDEDVYKATNTLNMITSRCQDPEKRLWLAGVMLSVNYVEIVQVIIKNHFEEAFTGEEDLKQMTYLSIFNFVFILLGPSDESEDICKQVLDTKLYVDLLDCLRSPHLSPSLMQETESFRMVLGILCLLHNLVHKLPDSWPEMRKHNAVEIMQSFRECSNHRVSCQSLNIQAYIITEKDNEKVNSDIKVFIHLLKMLDTTLEGKDFYGLSASVAETVEVINKLAVNDVNKTRIVEAGGLPYYVRMMKGGNRCGDDVIALAVEGIWLLGFTCKEEILKENDCVETLRSLLNHSNSEIVEKAKGALWTLEKLDALTTKVSQRCAKRNTNKKALSEEKEKVSDEVSGHVFISYQWDSKATILKVRDRLKAAGIKTWLDVDDMSGSVLEAMAVAVEKADMVIICISQKYKDSPNCRTEAEYTFRLHKRIVPLRLQEGYNPDGWLGILVGSQLVFDISHQDIYEGSVKQLLKYLSYKKDETHPKPQGATSKLPPKNEATEGATSKLPPKNETTAVQSVKLWKEKEVKEWLTKNKFQKLMTWFKDFDGRLLHEYALMTREAPESFYNHMFRHNIHIRDALALKIALRELLSA